MAAADYEEPRPAIAPLGLVLGLEELDADQAIFRHSGGEASLELSRITWEGLDRPSRLQIEITQGRPW